MTHFSEPRGRRVAAGVLAATAASLVLAACGSAGPTTDGGNTKTVAFAHPASSDSIYPLLQFGAQKAADDRDYKLLVSSANNDSAAQINELNTWIAQKIGGLIISPLDVNALKPVLAKAKKSDVKFLAYAADDIDGADGSVVFDNPQGGKLIGEAAGDWVKKTLGGSANVALLTLPDTATGRERIESAVAALKAKAPNVKIVAEQKAVFSAEALPVFQSMLQAHPDINVVFCIADDGCVGAEKAFNQTKPSADRRSKMFMGGWDGSKPVLSSIASGDSVIRATAVLNLITVGEKSIEATINAIEDEGETDISIPYELVTEADPTQAQTLIDDYDAASGKK